MCYYFGYAKFAEIAGAGEFLEGPNPRWACSNGVVLIAWAGFRRGDASSNFHRHSSLRPGQGEHRVDLEEYRPPTFISGPSHVPFSSHHVPHADDLEVGTATKSDY